MKEVLLPATLTSEPRWHWSLPLAWLGLGAAWYGGLLQRKSLLLHCVQTPEICQPDWVGWVDRWVLTYPHSPFLDSASFVTQDLSGVFFVLVTAAFSVRLPANQRLMPFLKWLAIGLTSTLLNGVCTEIARHIGQRPRPFVFLAPAEQGLNPQNYTSFYSGHTSFAASITMLTFLIATRQRNTSPFMRWRVGASGFVLTFLTGLFRVLSGRHFVTDVIAGALAGALVAWFIFRLLAAPRRV